MKRSVLKRLLAIALCLVSCVLITGPSDAAASEIAPANIKADYIYETLTVTTAQDKVIYYTDVYTDDVSKWYTCEVVNGKAVFDISWIKKSTNVRLYICGDKNEKIVSKDLVWQDKLSVTFTGTLRNTDITEAEEWKTAYAPYTYFGEDTGYFLFTTKINGRDTSYFDLDTIEWRKGDTGVWREYSELNIKEMYVKGITLNFRIKGTNDTATKEGQRASAVAKLSMAKLAVAPSVKLDTDTMTLDIKNGMEYSLNKKDWILIPEYSKKGTTDAVFITDTVRNSAIKEITTTTKLVKTVLHKLLNIPYNAKLDKATFDSYPAGTFTYTEDNTGVIIYIRTAANEKKTASHIKEIVVPFVPTALTVPPADVIKYAFTQTASFSGSVTFTNTSLTQKIQFAAAYADKFSDASNIDVSSSDLKWVTLKEGRSTKLNITSDFYLIYRLPGDDDMLPSTYRATALIQPSKQITYARLNNANLAVGATLTPMTSSNIKISEVTCTWQRCTDRAADVWTDIGTGSTYVLKDEDVGSFIRVKLSNPQSEATSEPIGPII